MVEFNPTEGRLCDPQTDTTSAVLKKLIFEDQFNAFCIDCQKNRSTHANVSFGVFICQECAIFHNANFPMCESYIKAAFDECWDSFQLQMVMQGGNKKFYEFLRTYEKEREPILKKYTTSAALYYRRKLSFSAKNLPCDELPPPRNAQEAAERAGKTIQTAGVKVTQFFNEADQKYKIGEKTSAMASSTKNAFIGLFNKAKEAVNQQQQD